MVPGKGTKMIKIFVIMFVVIFDYTGGQTRRAEIPMESVEKCFEQKRLVDKDPSVLYYNGKNIVNLQYGCVRYLKNYVEECEILPMDYVNKKECIPYWDHWSKHSRGESGTYKIEE